MRGGDDDPLRGAVDGGCRADEVFTLLVVSVEDLAVGMGDPLVIGQLLFLLQSLLGLVHALLSDF